MSLERPHSAVTGSATGTEENDFKQPIPGRLAAGLYPEDPDFAYPKPWTSKRKQRVGRRRSLLGRSRRNVAWYLVQGTSTGIARCSYNCSTARLTHVMRVVLQALRTQNLPVRLSAFSPTSLRQLPPNSHHPKALLSALFPHVNFKSSLVTSSTTLYGGH
jgi:hypothetical protein